MQVRFTFTSTVPDEVVERITVDGSPVSVEQFVQSAGDGVDEFLNGFLGLRTDDGVSAEVV